MPKSNTRHVVPAGPNKWVVKEPGKAAPQSTHRTQGAAEQAAKEALKPTGGNVVIHCPDGTIRDADTVAPAKDPFPPRDTRH
jgi:hypothetical protein